MVTLYLVRHGIAEERGVAWPDDSERPLTPTGDARVRQVARGLQRLGVGFDLILSSPFVRTRQTAELLSRGLSDQPPVRLCDALAPGGTIAALRDVLGRCRGATRLALVGHEPEIGQFAAHLVGARHIAIPFKKGAVCCLEMDGLPPLGDGRLRWLAPPRLLRLIGTS